MRGRSSDVLKPEKRLESSCLQKIRSTPRSSTENELADRMSVMAIETKDTGFTRAAAKRSIPKPYVLQAWLKRLYSFFAATIL